MAARYPVAADPRASLRAAGRYTNIVLASLVVAVLLNHMLRNPVASIKPSTILSPLVPVARIINKAMRV